MATLCGTCSGPVPGRDRGRPAKFCSPACKAKAYRARKAGASPGGGSARSGGAMSAREAARLAAFHAAAAIESALAGGWETLDRYGADRPRVESALNELRAELDRRARPTTRPPSRPRGAERRDESPEPVTESVTEPTAASAVEVPGPPDERTPVTAPPVRGDEKPEPVTQTPPAVTADAGPAAESAAPVTETEREREKREWEEQAERERAEFERRLKPVPEFGDGYQMAEWANTGRYYLVYQGERVGHATKKPFTTTWEAHSAHGPKIPFTGTYKTRRAALAEVARNHQHTAANRAKRRR